jgi:hypothetical protein
MNEFSPSSATQPGVEPFRAVRLTVSVNANQAPPWNPLIVWGCNRGPALAAAFNGAKSVHKP